jgi:hypothetical protein
MILIAAVSIVTLGVISYMIKDNEYDEWTKNKNK